MMNDILKYLRNIFVSKSNRMGALFNYFLNLNVMESLAIKINTDLLKRNALR